MTVQSEKSITEIINEKRANGEEIDWKEIEKLNKARTTITKIKVNMNRPR